MAMQAASKYKVHNHSHSQLPGHAGCIKVQGTQPLTAAWTRRPHPSARYTATHSCLDMQATSKYKVHSHSQLPGHAGHIQVQGTQPLTAAWTCRPHPSTRYTATHSCLDMQATSKYKVLSHSQLPGHAGHIQVQGTQSLTTAWTCRPHPSTRYTATHTYSCLDMQATSKYKVHSHLQLHETCRPHPSTRYTATHSCLVMQATSKYNVYNHLQLHGHAGHIQVQGTQPLTLTAAWTCRPHPSTRYTATHSYLDMQATSKYKVHIHLQLPGHAGHIQVQGTQPLTLTAVRTCRPHPSTRYTATHTHSCLDMQATSKYKVHSHSHS